MAASALLTAPNTLLSAAPDVTALPVPATAVPAGLAAASTSSATPRKMRTGLPSTLVDARRGVNLTVQEAISMASLIAPLLRQGLSPYQILAIHPELNISEKTLYNYIESGVFREIAGITSLDLRRQVSPEAPQKEGPGL